jgi:ABC-type branched-subunit amino acid transport system substrate-binding protein
MIKKAILALAALLLLLPAVACGPAAAKEINIGAVMDITGPLAGIGSIIRDGAVLAVKQINEAGGINGKQVKLIVEDGATDTTQGFEGVKKLVEVNGCKVIIGPMISPAVIAAGPYVAERDVVIVSPSATSPEITDQPWRQFVFRTCTSDILQGEAMTQLILEGGYKKVATLVVDNTYGAGIEEVVTEKLAGQAEFISPIKYDLAKLDYLTELQIIKDGNPDVIVHVGYHDDAQIVYKQALQLGLDSAQWIASEGVYSEYTLEMSEAAQFMEKVVIGTSPVAPEGLAAFDKLAAAYEAEFGIPPGVYVDTVYDATNMVLQAIEQAGYDGAKISAALLKIGQNYQGTSGTITFSPVGDRVSGDFEVWKVVKEAGEYKYERVKVISL